MFVTSPERASEFAAPDFFATRSPLLAFDELLRWADPGWQLAVDDPRFEDAFEDNRSALSRRLREALSRPEVREALFLATGQFEGNCYRWLSNPEGKPANEIELALSQELVRIATATDCDGFRMAPSVGEIGRGTSFGVGALSSRDSQIGIVSVKALAEVAAPLLHDKLRFFNNSSLYRVHGKVRCLASHSRTSGAKYRFEYRLITAGLTAHLETIIRRAESGASLEQLVSAVATMDPEVSREEAASYVRQLIEEQVLVPELGPQVADQGALAQLVDELKKLAVLDDAVRPLLDRACEAIALLDSGKFGAPMAQYRHIAPFVLRTALSSPLFHVQVFRSAHNVSFSSAIAQEILRGAEALASIERPNDRLRRFTESFYARYGDEVVPLVEALDQQYGIDFEGSTTATEPLLKSLAFAPPSESVAGWGPRERLLLQKLEDAWRTNARVISLTPEELGSIRASDPLPLPDSFAVSGQLSAASEAALEAGEYMFRLDSVSGPPGVASLAPFCRRNAELRDRVASHLRAEEALQPEAIFAEIIHLPHVGDPDLIVRAKLRDREIPYLGRSASDVEHRIPVTDLRLSVVAERLHLTSEPLGCEVIPRLTATHDFRDPKNPAIYRFLCALQNQETAGRLRWNWGAFESAAFLPRVVSGKTVLSRARWTVDGPLLQEMAKSSGADRFRAICRLRERLQLPRFIELGEARARSVFDLENVLSAECLSQRMQSEPRATLVEMFPTPGMLCATGPDGRYIHELTVPFLRRQTVAPPRSRALRLAVQRSFMPGSEWLQVNLYAPSPVLDEVLREVVAPAIGQGLATAAAHQWYFMRYTDPGFHVRLRLHGAPDRLISEVSADLRARATPMLEDRRMWAIKLDTYHRDFGRYGGAEGALAAEKIFHADSDAVLSIIQQLSDAELEASRWQLAFIGIEMLLSDLPLSPAQKVAALKTARDDIAVRLRADATLDAQIVRRYQTKLSQLRELLASEPEMGSALARGLSALRRRSEMLKPVCAELVELERADHLSRSIADQAYSYIHMFANRLFPSGLAQELVLYDFLHRLTAG